MPWNWREAAGEEGELAQERKPVATDFSGGQGYTVSHREVTGLGIYLDLAVMLNTLVDFLLLVGTNTLAGFPAQGKRCIPELPLGVCTREAVCCPGFGFWAVWGGGVCFLG